MYSSYRITEESKVLLNKTFSFLYEQPYGHHITVEFGKDATLPEPKICTVYGYINHTDGLEAILVMIDGERYRKDNNYYHITWSLDPTKYKPADSNEIIKQHDYMPCFFIDLFTTPELISFPT